MGEIRSERGVEEAKEGRGWVRQTRSREIENRKTVRDWVERSPSIYEFKSFVVSSVRRIVFQTILTFRAVPTMESRVGEIKDSGSKILSFKSWKYGAVIMKN